MKARQSLKTISLLMMIALITTLSAFSTTGSAAEAAEMEAHVHEFTATAHDGSAICRHCGKFERNDVSVGVFNSQISPDGSFTSVFFEIKNSDVIRLDTAMITLSGGFLQDEIVLSLFHGRVATTTDGILSFGAKNTVGYIGAQLKDDRLIFQYASPRADEEHPEGTITEMQYTINFMDEVGNKYEICDSFSLRYVPYQIASTNMTEEGAKLKLSFYSILGNEIRTNKYDNGTYSIDIADHYGSKETYEYVVDSDVDTHVNVTREDTPTKTTIHLKDPSYGGIRVSVEEGPASAVQIQGNNYPAVLVTVTDSVKLRYDQMNSEGETVTRFIVVNRPSAGENSFERLGYTAPNWEDPEEYALATDGVTKYRNGNVTVYLKNCIFRDSGEMAHFTFTPGGAQTHTFSKDNLLLLENGAEIALTEDVTVSIDAVLMNDHVFHPATCTTAKICQYCGESEGEALGHRWNEGEVTTEPTCTSTGTKTFTCQHDSSHSYTEPIATVDHIDADENAICDECGAELPREGLSGGVIAGIVIASVAVGGLGGFLIFRFRIKKKR